MVRQLATAIAPVCTRPRAELDVRQQRRRSLGDAVVALEPRHRLVQPGRHGAARRPFGYRDDIRTAAHHGSKVIHAVLVERVDADRDHHALVAPGRVEIGRQLPAPFGRSDGGVKSSSSSDQHVGAAWRRVLQHLLVAPSRNSQERHSEAGRSLRVTPPRRRH